MRRDLIIGIVSSILIHVGLAWGGNIDLNFGDEKKVVKDEAPQIELMEMPKLEPEIPDTPDEAEAAAETAALAPPSIADVPGVVSIDSFVQAVQPPPPPKASISMTVPKNTAPKADLKDVFDLRSLDQQPVMRNRLNPVYPFEMKRLGITGEVIVEFVIDANGDVRDARVVRSTRSEFESAALEAVQKLKFRPGRKGGRAVGARLQQPITFVIEE